MPPNEISAPALSNPTPTRLIGVDESGAPRFNPNDLVRTPFFTVCAAEADEAAHPEINAAFDRLETECFGVPAEVDFELHLRDLVPGTGEFEGVNWSLRRRFIEGAIVIAAEHGVRFVARGLHLAGVPAGQRGIDPYSLGVAGLIAVSDGAGASRASFVVDDTTAGHKSRILAQLKATGTRPAGVDFIDSKGSRLIQLADLAAYCLRVQAGASFSPLRSAAPAPKDSQPRRRQHRVVASFHDALAGHLNSQSLAFPADRLALGFSFGADQGDKLPRSIAAQAEVDAQFDWSSGQPRPIA